MEMKYFVPMFGSYYHFITESALGLYLLLKENSRLTSLDCHLWYQGKYDEIVQMFSCHPIVKIPLKPRLRNAKTIGKDIKTLKHKFLQRKKDFYPLVEMAKFLSERIPIEESPKGITIIKRTNTREYIETDELYMKLKYFRLPVKMVQFEKLSFQEQVNTARNTIILIAPHGAGTLNQMFMPRGARIIELFPKGDYNWHAKAVSDVFGHELIEIESTQPGHFAKPPGKRIQLLIEKKGWPGREMVQRQPGIKLRSLLEEKGISNSMTISILDKFNLFELGRFVRNAKTFSINPDIIVNHVQRILCNI
jgi:hypothetical protein